MDSKVIDIKKPAMLPIKPKKKGWCAHDYIEVDEDERTLTCTKCGAYVDPFNYVLSLAKEERSIHQWIEMLKKERSQLFEEKEKLKSQLSYLKSQIKKVL